MKRKAMALILGMTLVTTFMPVYAEGGEGVESQTSAPVQAPAPEAPPTAAPITEKPEAEVTPAPTAAPTQTPFTAKVKIELENKGQIYFGDKVILKAKVKQANAEYTVRWEYYNVNADIEHGENPWVLAHKGEKYEFTVNEENAKLTYRLVINDEVFVKDYELPEVKAKPVEEPEETAEPQEDEEVAEPEEDSDEENTEPEETEEPTEVPDEPDESEATEEPAKPEAPEVSAEPKATEQPALNLEDELDPNRSIAIRAEWEGEELHFGDDVTLIAELSGYEGAVYTIQWQSSKDEVKWTDVDGATEESYVMTVTEDNYQDFWRVIVTVTDIVAE